MLQRELRFSPHHLFFLLGMLSLFLHVPFMKLPPVGTHVFRQAHTLSVARNFARESMDITQPRVDRRYETNGVTGANFPLYEWGLGMVWRITGVSEFVQRAYSFFWYLVALSGAILFFYTVFSSSFQRILAATFFAFSPEIFYNAINALPDISSLAFASWGMYFFFSARNSGGGILLLFSAISFWLMALIKIYFITIVVIPASFLLFAFLHNQLSRARFVRYVMFSILLFASILAWYKYADYLIQYNGLYEFGLHTRLTQSWSDAKQILMQNAISDLPELLLGYPAILVLLLSIFVFFRNIKTLYRHSVWFWPLMLWLVGVLVVHFFLLEQMRFHNYYMMPYIMPLVLFSVKGVGRFQFFKRNEVLILLVLSSIAWSAIRIIPARWLPSTYAVSENLLDKKIRGEITAIQPALKGFTLAGPDYSGCIFFYFFDKKGAVFNDYSQLLTVDSLNQHYLDKMIERGATQILIQNPPEEVLKQLLTELKEWEKVYDKKGWVMWNK